MNNRYYWLGNLMKKHIEKIWLDIIAGKAIAINQALSISGEAARGFLPHVGDWEIRYLGKTEAWRLSDGVLSVLIKQQ